MKYLLFLLISSFSFIITAHAQTNWIVYDTTNSPLPVNKTYKVIEDNYGNIWASTQKGLVKFDGVNWTVYDSIPGTNYALNNLFALTYDTINDWIYVSMPGLLIRFDGTNWNFWSHFAYSNEDVVDSQGRVWMALYNLGIGVFDGTSFTYYDTTNSPIPNPVIFDIEIDHNDVLWILSGPGLTRFDGSTWTVYDTANSPLPTNAIFGIGVDNNNSVWVHGATNQNDGFIYSFDGSNWVAFDTTICQPLFAYSFIEPDALNNIWISSYGAGLQMVNSTSCSTYTDLNSPLPTNYLHDTFITSSQVLWMTSQLNGLIRTDLPVGMTEVAAINEINVFPNPAHSSITIKNISEGNISIYNLLGEELFTGDINVVQPMDLEVNIKKFNPGVYILRTNKRMTKLIIQ